MRIGPIGDATVTKLAANLPGGEDLSAVITTLEYLAGMRASDASPGTGA